MSTISPQMDIEELTSDFRPQRSADDEFLYEELPEATAQSARSDADFIRSKMESIKEGIFDVGVALRRQKQALPHGMFLRWIRDEFKMSDRSARNYMNVAEVYHGKSATVSNLDVSTLYELAAPSTPVGVRSLVEKKAAQGKMVKKSEVKKLKRAALEKPKPEKPDDHQPSLSEPEADYRAGSSYAEAKGKHAEPRCDGDDGSAIHALSVLESAVNTLVRITSQGGWNPTENEKHRIGRASQKLVAVSWRVQSGTRP